MARNYHRVDRERWSELSGQEQALFNRMWATINDPYMFPASLQEKITNRDFNVIRRNVCMTAAWTLRRIRKEGDK